MVTKFNIFNQKQLKSDLPYIRPGDTVRISQKIAEKGEKERIQHLEGLVITRKHGKGISATITVRKIIDGIGVEWVLPIHSPNIQKIEVLKRGKVRRAKLYYLREVKGKKAKLKYKEFGEVVAEKPAEEIKEETPPAEEKVAGE